jgi:hypothetical protein
MGENKFCYIFGSFAELGCKLRTPESDIDILCDPNLDMCEARQLLFKRFPHLDRGIPIQLIYAKVDSNTITRDICYWQEGKFIELYNRHNIQYNINLQKKYDIGSYLRDPDRSMFRKHLRSSSIEVLNKNYCTAVKSHYGVDNFLNTIRELEQDEEELWLSMYSEQWKLNDNCKGNFGIKYTINRGSKEIIGESYSLGYKDFTYKCLRKNEI